MTRTKHKPQIVPSQLGIGTILKTYRLKVPAHQREYRWTTHVQKLFEDLQQALDSDQQEYFLGTIVTIPDEDGTLEVIDGQQRLATITILLSQIRRYLEDVDKGIATSLQGFIEEYDRKGGEWVPKLGLNLLDRDFFGQMLKTAPPYPELSSTAPVSHKRIRAAFIAAQNYVEKIVALQTEKNKHGTLLNKWIDFIEADAEAILFRVPSGSNAYKMFETLNDRGLKTTQADLVKCYLFGKSGDARLQEAQAAWSLMGASLASLQGDEEEDDDDKEDITVIFLRTALIAIHGFLTSGQVFQIVQKLAGGPQTVISLLRTFENLAHYYEATFFSDHENWKKCPQGMKNAIQTINNINIKPFRPTLLAIAAKFSPTEATKAFEMFVSLGVRMLLTTGTRSGNVEQGLAAAAHKIFTNVITTTVELKKDISTLIPSDQAFREAFQVASVSSAPLARYYLRAMENVVQNSAYPWFVTNENKEVMTLEHVLPKNPEGNWPQFTEDDVKKYARRIGNLCLLPKGVNDDLKSADQATKYAVYKDAPYRLTSQIVDATQWNAEAICKRQVGLAQLATKAWPL